MLSSPVKAEQYVCKVTNFEHASVSFGVTEKTSENLSFDLFSDGNVELTINKVEEKNVELLKKTTGAEVLYTVTEVKNNEQISMCGAFDWEGNLSCDGLTRIAFSKKRMEFVLSAFLSEVDSQNEVIFNAKGGCYLTQ